MHLIAHILLACFYVALYYIPAAKREIASKTLQATRHLVEFFFYSKYKQHDTNTLALMEESLIDFYCCRMVFLQYQAGKHIRDTTNKQLKKLQAECNQVIKGENTGGYKQLKNYFNQ